MKDCLIRYFVKYSVQTRLRLLDKKPCGIRPLTCSLRLYRHRVRGRRKRDTAPREWLSPRLEDGEPLRGGEALVLLEVLEEREDVPGERSDCRLGDEGEDRRRAVRAGEELPGLPPDGGRRDGCRAGGGDGAGAAESVEPDHDLVVIRTAVRRRSHQVVRHISDDAGA